jgi:hypothetical protein
MAAHEAMIRVQSDWNGWRTAEVRLGDLHDVHWLQPGHAPQPLIHGYVACTAVLTAAIPHDCGQRPSPHRLLVCVLKKHTMPSTYAELERLAEAHRPMLSHARDVASRQEASARPYDAADRPA